METRPYTPPPLVKTHPCMHPMDQECKRGLQFGWCCCRRLVDRPLPMEEGKGCRGLQRPPRLSTPHPLWPCEQARPPGRRKSICCTHCGKHLAVAQDHRLHRLARQECSRLEGKQVVPVCGGALQPANPTRRFASATNPRHSCGSCAGCRQAGGPRGLGGPWGPTLLRPVPGQVDPPRRMHRLHVHAAAWIQVIYGLSKECKQAGQGQLQTSGNSSSGRLWGSLPSEAA
jgi:hypothetical protein